MDYCAPKDQQMDSVKQPSEVDYCTPLSHSQQTEPAKQLPNIDHDKPWKTDCGLNQGSWLLLNIII